MPMKAYRIEPKITAGLSQSSADHEVLLRKIDP